LSVVKKAKYDKNSVYVTCQRAVNHSSVLLKPRERGCFAYFHHKNGYGVGACHGKPLRHAKLTLKIGRSTPFMGFWWRRQVVYRLPLSTQNHQNNYGQALYAVPTPHCVEKGGETHFRAGFSPRSNFLGRGLGVG